MLTYFQVYSGYGRYLRFGRASLSLARIAWTVRKIKGTLAFALFIIVLPVIIAD